MSKRHEYRIGIWGQFGSGRKIADGQAVRTTIITNELKSRYGEKNIQVVNTNNWNKHPLNFLFKTVRLLINCKKIVILPADNGFKIVVPLMYYFNKLYKRELYDVVIGGFMPKLLEAAPKYIKMLNNYTALFVQTDTLRMDLENLGIKNVHILSNLKRLNTLKETDIEINLDKHICVCTISRINEEKGIDDAFEAVKLANRILNGEYIRLHLYGPVVDSYLEHFNVLLEENKSFAEYKGIVDYDKTVETLNGYFALIFATHYYGEGFPGNVVDAFNSALPIIATNWMYNRDVIVNGKNGILVPIKDPHSICNGLLYLYYNREFHHKIAINNINEAAKYHPDRVLQTFYEFMDR